MSDDYFMLPLREAGINLTLPTELEQKTVQEVQIEVSKGKIDNNQKNFFSRLIDNYPNVDGVILACTELPLIAPLSSSRRPIINPSELQCQAAIKFALNS